MMTAFFVAGPAFRRTWRLHRRIREMTWAVHEFAVMIGRHLIPTLQRASEAFAEFARVLAA